MAILSVTPQLRDTVSTIQAMLQHQSKLCNSIDQYQQAAEDLEAELVKTFHELSKKNGMRPWKSRPLFKAK
jgi:hypothetical protein